MEQPTSKRQRLGDQLPPLQEGMLVCSACKASKPPEGFYKKQRRKGAASRQCSECQDKPPMLHCSACKVSKPAHTAFSKKQKLRDAASRQCIECRHTTRMCSICNKSKVADAFPLDGDQTKCLKCLNPKYRCSICNKSLIENSFPKDGDKSECTRCLSKRTCAKCQKSKTPDKFRGDDEKVCKMCRIAQEKRTTLFHSFHQAKAKYDIPTWMWDIPVRSGSVKQQIRLEDLVGEYDIVFLAVSSSDLNVQCTTQHQHRKLQLGLHPTKKDSLLGVVEKTQEGEGEGENGYVCVFDDKFTFETKVRNTRIAALAFELIGELPFNCREDEVSGHLQVLDRMEACPWIPTAVFTQGRNAFLDRLAQPRFESVEAARAANREHSHFVPLWMQNNISFPNSVLRMVYEFSTERPAAPPALFFEPGDVLLRVNWGEDYHDPFFSIQVARRRVDQN